MQIQQLTKTVATAGTRGRLTLTSTMAKWVKLQNTNASETGIAVVGGPTVVAAAGGRSGICIDQPAAPGSGQPGSYEKSGVEIPGPLNLKDLWLDSTVDNHQIIAIYEEMP